MTIYLPGRVGADEAVLEDFPSSQRSALGAAVEEAWQSNPTIVLNDAANLYEAKTGKSILGPSLEVLFSSNNPALMSKGLRDLYRTVTAPDTTAKLPKTQAEETAKQAGITLKIPDEGMSQAALDLLIQRQQNNRRINDTLARAPGGLVNVGTRFMAQLGVTVLDPINVGSAFVPVVGEGRYAQLIARAAGTLERTGVRAAVGAAEGAAGAALVEPTLYAARTQLQDDYTMANSLENIAFGTVLGGGLHAAGGGIADLIRGRQPVLEAPALEPATIAAPKQSISLTDEAFNISRRIDNGSLSVEQFAQLYRDDPRLAQEVVSVRLGDTGGPERAPFPEGYTPASARTQAIRELTPEFKAELLAEGGNPAEAGAIANLKAQQAELTKELERLKNEPQAVFREEAKDLQRQGMSRKQAEAEARQRIVDREADLTAREQALRDEIAINARSEQANQAARELEKGSIPPRFEARVQERVNQILGKNLLQSATALPPEASARFAIANASPEVRRAALTSAVSQMVNGRLPDVESLVRSQPNDPMAVDKLVESSRRTQSPESLAVGNFDAARAADEKLQSAPQMNDLAAAEQADSLALENLRALQENLEQGGFAVDIKTELQAFDDAVKSADEYGRAVKAAALCGVRQ